MIALAALTAGVSVAVVWALWRSRQRPTVRNPLAPLRPIRFRGEPR